MKTVLVVAAHADDEALGCGGTLARHATAGDEVHLLIMADGVSSRINNGAREQQLRQQATAESASILGLKSVCFIGLPDNRLDSVPLLDVIQPIESVISNINPSIVYTHHWGDLNVDHRITHQAVMTACRPIPSAAVREILTFEVMSSTEWSTPGLAPFIPNLYVDITQHLKTKLRALEAYQLEMRGPPHSRSLRHVELLALHRGFSVGMGAAEAFAIARQLR